MTQYTASLFTPSPLSSTSLPTLFLSPLSPFVPHPLSLSLSYISLPTLPSLSFSRYIPPSLSPLPQSLSLSPGSLCFLLFLYISHCPFFSISPTSLAFSPSLLSLVFSLYLSQCSNDKYKLFTVMHVHSPEEHIAQFSFHSDMNTFC